MRHWPTLGCKIYLNNYSFLCAANALIEEQLPQESGMRSPDTPQEQERLTFLSTCTYILQFCLNTYLE